MEIYNLYVFSKGFGVHCQEVDKGQKDFNWIWRLVTTGWSCQGPSKGSLEQDQEGAEQVCHCGGRGRVLYFPKVLVLLRWKEDDKSQVG